MAERPVIVTDVQTRQYKLLGPGESASWGRSGASTPLDFRIHDSVSLSRRAGCIEVLPGGGTRVVSTQRDGCGGVQILAASGTVVASLGYGEEYRCHLPEFRIRLRIDGVGS